MPRAAENLTLIVVLSFFIGSVQGQTTSTPGRVFVVNTQDASVSLVDITTMKEVQRIPVGPRPYGVVVSRDGRTLAVGVEDEEKVKFFDTTHFKLLGETRVGKMFNDHMVLSTDGRYVLVANFLQR